MTDQNAGAAGAGGDSNANAGAAAAGAGGNGGAAAGNPGAGNPAASAAAGGANGASANAWGDNWRQTYAGDNTKLLARLERYQSPKAALDALISAQDRISSGDLRKPLGENPTPEELTAYRQQNGIPDKAEGYFEKLPNGLVIGDADKPLFNSFAEGLHKLNAPPAVAHYAVEWYNKFQEEQIAKEAENDTAQKSAVEDELRAEWGADYRANIHHIQSFLSQAPKGVADMIANARGPDGRALMNDPNAVKWFAQLAREANPLGQIVPAGGGGLQGVEDEIATIEKTMRDNRTAYNKDEKMQARYRDLLDARERFKQKSG